MARDLTLAVAQSPANLVGPQARLDWLRGCLDSLAGQGIDLLILPELFLTGYNVGDAVAQWGEPADGPSFEVISALAQRHGTAIHYGFAEATEGHLFNTANCVGKDGQLLSTHRKLLLPPGFEGDHFSPGSCYTMFEIEGITAATLICYDAEFPETFRAVAAAGAALVLVPTALGAQWGVVADCVIPARAFENGVYICYANSAGHENGMDFLGSSCIIGPDGKALARAGDRSEVLIARFNGEKVKAAQTRLPYLIDRKALPQN